MTQYIEQIYDLHDWHYFECNVVKAPQTLIKVQSENTIDIITNENFLKLGMMMKRDVIADFTFPTKEMSIVTKNKNLNIDIEEFAFSSCSDAASPGEYVFQCSLYDVKTPVVNKRAFSEIDSTVTRSLPISRNEKRFVSDIDENKTVLYNLVNVDKGSFLGNIKFFIYCK